ncbi:hypothetical protein [Thalassotalea ganghwensis]
MSFIKSLFIATLATFFLTFVFGASLIELFDINVYAGDSIVEPLKAISISALVVVVIMVAVVAVILSVFGTLIFVGILVAGSIALVVLGMFWPILIAAVLIWLLVRDKPNKTYAE